MVVFRIEASNTLCEKPALKETHMCSLSHLTTVANTKTSVSTVQMTIENAF